MGTGTGTGGGGRSRVLRSLFGALVVVGFIWFLLVGILANRATKRTTTTTRTITIPSTENFKHLKLLARERHAAHQDSDLYYVSKRRVPSGPDPIHNRRAGQARQPPGRT